MMKPFFYSLPEQLSVSTNLVRSSKRGYKQIKHISSARKFSGNILICFVQIFFLTLEESLGVLSL